MITTYHQAFVIINNIAPSNRISNFAEIKFMKMKNKYLLTVIVFLIIGRGICWGQTAYVTNGGNIVTVINVITNTVITDILVGSSPSGVSVSSDGTKVYVANSLDNTVSVINTASNTVSSVIPVGNEPFGIAVSPDNTTVYVTNDLGNTVSVINTATNTVISTISVDSHPVGIAVSPDGNKVYVANRNANTISIIWTPSNTVIGTIPVMGYPLGITVSPDGSRAYVTHTGSQEVSVINAISNIVSDTIIVGIDPSGIVVSPDNSKVFVANGSSSNSVSVISSATDTILATIPVGLGPYGISISPDGSKVYVANNSAHSVSVINTATNIVSATIAISGSPTAFGNFISIYTSPAINTNSVVTSVCAGSGLLVPYTAFGIFNFGNTFIAQLSNAIGSFTSTVNIGTLISVQSGTISATIPSNTIAGLGYRIRVVSSNTAATFTDNGNNIIVNPLPVITVNSPTICAGDTASLAANGATAFTWSAGADSTGANTASASPLSTTTYTVTGTSSGCAGSAMSVVTVDCAVGISQTIINPNSLITISPNPFTEMNSIIYSLKHQSSNLLS